jgi:ATP-dependent Lon protease
MFGKETKELQNIICAVEFRNTNFIYVMGTDGISKFVSTLERQNENRIGGDPLETGQV